MKFSEVQNDRRLHCHSRVGGNPESVTHKKRPRLSAGSSFQTLLSQCLALGRLNVRRRRAFRALLQLEFHLLSLGQALEARTLDGGVMHEDILTAV